MVLESWESRGIEACHILRKALFRALANSMHNGVYQRAHGRLRAMGLEPLDSRRVALSFGLCFYINTPAVFHVPKCLQRSVDSVIF